MTDDILYSRPLADGPAVRVRRLTPAGAIPVIAVLEVERRTGSRRERAGFPPPLMSVQGESEAEVLSALQQHALDDRTVAGLMREKGLG